MCFWRMHGSFRKTLLAERICRMRSALGAFALFFVTPAPEGFGYREVQYRARKQAAVSPVGRLLTRAVLYRRLKVAGLREAHASGRIGDRVSVTARRMDRSRAAGLSCEC